MFCPGWLPPYADGAYPHFCRLHNRMPVLLPTLEAQDAWLGDTMDFK